MSIKLHGVLLSNYYSIVKAVLLEKGIEFEELVASPNQESEYLVKSPMGKVPCLETEQGFLTESGVILDYLDALGEGPSFYPSDAFEKAKVQELMRYLELYIELPGRRLYGDVFFGRPASEEEKAAVKPLLEKGFAALQRIAKFEPYLAGSEISYADFYCLFALAPVTLVCKKTWDWDVRNEIAGLKELFELLGTRDSVKKVRGDQEQAA
jgi:glutathione S-transferase